MKTGNLDNSSSSKKQIRSSTCPYAIQVYICYLRREEKREENDVLTYRQLSSVFYHRKEDIQDKFRVSVYLLIQRPMIRIYLHLILEIIISSNSMFANGTPFFLLSLYSSRVVSENTCINIFEKNELFLVGQKNLCRHLD